MPKKKVEKKVEKKEKKSAFDALRERLGIVKASEARSAHIIKIPTGLAGLDFSLGGGLPRGRVVELAGPESAGKTLLALHTAGNLQRVLGKNARILLATPEGQIDKVFARKIGFIIPCTPDELQLMDAERKRVGRPLLTREERDELLREVCPVDQLPVETAEVTLQKIIDAAKSDEYDLIILDSVSALIAGDDVLREKQGKEIEVPVGGERPYGRNINGILGSFTNRWFLEIGKDSWKGRPNNTTLIVISQVRADVGGTGKGFAWKVAGSCALKHAKTIDIWVYHGTRQKQGDEIIGRHVNWLIAKAKCGAKEGDKSSVPFYFNRGFDMAEALFDACQEHGLARSPGGGKWDLVTKDGEVVAEYPAKEFGGMLGVIDKLRKDPEMQALWQRTLSGLYEAPPITDPHYWEG